MSVARYIALTGDYQWPSGFSLPRSFRRRVLPGGRPATYERRIEEFFEKRLGGHAVVMPSARAGLSMILRIHRFERRHVVYVPKWVSHCLWDVVGRYANPSVAVQGAPDAMLAVHKWGQASRLSGPIRALVIEDSVDSIIEDCGALFPNGGVYELLSFPKTLGSYCGGLVLCRDAYLAEGLRRTRWLRLAPRGGFAAAQSRLKYRSAQSGWASSLEWEYSEYRNARLDVGGLQHIVECLPNYDANAAQIRRRMRIVSESLGGLWARPTPGRLPPVAAVPCARFGRGSAPADVMVRQHDFSACVDKPVFEPAYLVPLHFGVPESLFEKVLGRLAQLKPK